jgi:hypothetical protein
VVLLKIRFIGYTDESHAPPPPKGAGLAQGGHLLKGKKLVAERFREKKNKK